MKFMGIDPGQGGGISVLCIKGTVLDAVKMPRSNHALLDFLREWDAPMVVALEFVRSSPQMGRRGVFQFGWGLGVLEMGLTASGLHYSVVTPQKWQRAMACMSGGDKNVTKSKAIELFPGRKITHYVADSLLIAEYARRYKLGLVHKPTRRS